MVEVKSERFLFESISDKNLPSAEQLQIIQLEDILAALQEKPFRKLTELTRRVFGVDHAAINIVDHKTETQWINACETVEHTQTTLDDSVCKYTIRQKDVLVIPDLNNDERTAHRDFPDRFDIQFYAGAPFNAFGDALEGTLCLMDSETVDLTEEDRQGLSDFRDVCIRLIDQQFQLMRSEEAISLLNGTLDATADGILIVNNGKMVNYNEQFQEIWDLPKETLDQGDLDRAIDEAARRVKDEEQFLKTVRTMYESEETERFDEVHLKDGRILERYAMPRLVDGEQQGWVISFRDVTEQRRLQQQLEAQAEYDQLTGLANRQTFESHVVKKLQDSDSQFDHAALVAMNISHFDRINRALGYSAGDETLRYVGRSLRSYLPDEAIVCRFESDEFMFCLPDVEKEDDVEEVVTEFFRQFDDKIEIDETEFRLDFDLGAVFYPLHSEHLDELIDMAITAMERSTDDPETTCRFYLESMEEFDVNLLNLEKDYRKAFEAEDLELHYQPRVRLPEGNPIGMEALIRWNHPYQNNITPPIILELANSTNTTYQLDCYVLKDAADYVSSLEARLQCSVNVAAPTFMQGKNFVDTIDDLINNDILQPEQIEFEITERTAIDNADLARSVLSDLRDRDISIAVDDFGTGYSSLVYLTQFPIDTLKIDRKFISGIHDSSRNYKLVQSVTEMAQNLGLTVVAEGPEETEEIQVLKEIGCDEAQGYYYSRPLEPSSFRNYLVE